MVKWNQTENDMISVYLWNKFDMMQFNVIGLNQSIIFGELELMKFSDNLFKVFVIDENYSWKDKLSEGSLVQCLNCVAICG